MPEIYKNWNDPILRRQSYTVEYTVIRNYFREQEISALKPHLEKCNILTEIMLVSDF